MTSPVAVPGYGKLMFREVPKEELLAVWQDIMARTGLEVRTRETVTGMAPLDDGFEVTSTHGSYRAKQVVLAIGRRGIPRKLGVPGESLPKVIYSLREPEAYKEDRVLVVGGGDSAIEAALALADVEGNAVTISYRGERFSRLKPANLARVEEALRTGRIAVVWSSTVLEILPDAVRYRSGDGAEHEVANDVVAVFAGGELPTAFLRSCGVEFDTKFGTP